MFAKDGICVILLIEIMFYEHNIAKEIYSKYLNGMDVETIACYMEIEEGCSKVTPEDVNEVIDYMNSLYF